MDTVAPAIFCRGCGYSLHGLEEHRCPECGRGFNPSNPATYAVPQELADTIRRGEQRVLAILRLIRPVAVPLVALGAWGLILSLRTTGPAAQVSVARDVLALAFAALIVGGVPSLLVWLGAPRRRYWAAVLLTALLPALLAEGVATLEERLFLAECRNLPATAPVVFKDRWWPNADHYLYYDPETGTLGGGD